MTAHSAHKPAIPKTLARRLAVQFLFQSERRQSWVVTESEMDDFLEWRGYAGDIVVRRFFCDFVRQVFSARLKIDALIKPYCVKFKFERLLATDRSVLRLAVSELISCSAPAKVVMDEAIELARTYGDQSSAKFVNAVLDKVFAANFKTTHISEEIGVRSNEAVDASPEVLGVAFSTKPAGVETPFVNS